MTGVEYEVCVIGGGPAGAASALHLARLGRRVAVLEAARFPRPHVGESMGPSVLPVLEALGVRRVMESAPFLRPTTAKVLWSSTAAVEKRFEAPGFQLDRGLFDALMLEAAAGSGAEVHQGCCACRPTRRAEGGWRVPWRAEGGIGALSAAVVVDAAGRRGVRPRRRRRWSAPTAALVAYWRGVGELDQSSLVEAGEAEWMWAAPLPGGSATAAVFLSPERVAGAGAAERRQMYAELIGGSRLLARPFLGASMGPVVCCDASGSVDGEPIGDDFVKVGDACLTVDPLSSQGVQLALSSGLQGAAAADALLSPDRAALAGPFLRYQQERSLVRHRRYTASHYAQCAQRGEFWVARAAGASPPLNPSPPGPAPSWVALPPRLRRSPRVRFDTIPALVDGRIAAVEAIRHPELDEPLAFLGGLPIAELLRRMGTPTPMGLVKSWLGEVPLEPLLTWLWQRDLVQAAV
jgi:flavin-dependent dehydrogenase